MVEEQHLSPRAAIREINNLDGNEALTLRECYAHGLRRDHLIALKAIVERSIPSAHVNIMLRIVEEQLEEDVQSVQQVIAWIEQQAVENLPGLHVNS